MRAREILTSTFAESAFYVLLKKVCIDHWIHMYMGLL